jgi:hypothetical protein
MYPLFSNGLHFSLFLKYARGLSTREGFSGYGTLEGMEVNFLISLLLLSNPTLFLDIQFAGLVMLIWYVDIVLCSIAIYPFDIKVIDSHLLYLNVRVKH